MKKTVLFALGLALAAGWVISCGSAAADADAFKVEIGESASMAKKAKSHDITKEALEEGKTDYTVTGSDEASYKISLSEKQIEDLLSGTTVIVETAQGGMKVKIGPAGKKAKKSGW